VALDQCLVTHGVERVLHAEATCRHVRPVLHGRSAPGRLLMNGRIHVAKVLHDTWTTIVATHLADLVISVRKSNAQRDEGQTLTATHTSPPATPGIISSFNVTRAFTTSSRMGTLKT